MRLERHSQIRALETFDQFESILNYEVLSTYYDLDGRTIFPSTTARRIVSFLPSAVWPPCKLPLYQVAQSTDGICINTNPQRRLNDRRKTRTMIIGYLLLERAFSFRLIVDTGVNTAVHKET